MARICLPLTALGLTAWLATPAALAQGYTETVLHNFTGTGTDGSSPDAGLTDVGGTLYGTTFGGGSSNSGTVYSIDPSGNYSTLHSFGSMANEGSYPSAGLLDVGGTLYGTTRSGGAGGVGTVFSVDTSGNLSTLHSFQYVTTDGSIPWAGLIYSGGTFYGTTEDGGTNHAGTVFSMDPSGNITLLHSFSGADGHFSDADLVDVNGTLYGTTFDGGSKNQGVVYSVDTSGNFTLLHSFGTIVNDGGESTAGLVSLNGLLYGTTAIGGSHSGGTVYSIDSSGNLTTVYSFGGSSGVNPISDLIAADGLLYGTASSGGPNGNGTVFSLDPTTGALTTLYSFSGSDGSEPTSSLLDVNGTLYGTTNRGGTSGYGTVFALTPSGTATPEPASWVSLLLGSLGLLGLALNERRRRA